MNQWCKVCDEPAAGFHFGAFTCEGCKSFFGRAHTNPTAAVAIECKTGGGRCVIDKKNRTSCKACRLKKCLAAGMSKSGSRYGRRSNWFKIHCLLQQQQQQQQQQRRLPRRIEDECGRGCGDDDGCSDPPRPRPTRLPSLPVPLSRMPLLFGFAPKSRAPLPRSEHSAFNEAVKSVDGAGRGGGGNSSDNDDDDRPIDLTVRQSFTKDDDNNNEMTDKCDPRRRALLPQEYNWRESAAAPLDLTRAKGRHFGIRS